MAEVYLVEHPPAVRQFRSPRRAAPSGVVVVHTAESFPDESPPDTGAENVAAFIARRTNAGSYHDLADSDSIIQLVRYSDEAFHDATGSNPHSYGVSAATQAAKWSQLDDDWVDATVRNMAAAAARYATWLNAERGIMIPAERISRAQSEARLPGFISHAERDPARRTDPGAGFPWAQFLADFADIMEDDDMPTIEELMNHRIATGQGAFAVATLLANASLLPRIFNQTNLDVDALAAAIAAKLPSGTIELAVVKQGVREVLREGVSPIP